MIDAYEIGIQLALEDGVSAGLALINQELAEVDRAIAVTSAGLENMTRVAQTAAKAAAVASGLRPSTTSAQSTIEPAPAATGAEGGGVAVVNDNGGDATPPSAAAQPFTSTVLESSPPERSAWESSAAPSPVPVTQSALTLAPVVKPTGESSSPTLNVQQQVSLAAPSVAQKALPYVEPVSSAIVPAARASDPGVPIQQRRKEVGPPSFAPAPVSERGEITATVAQTLVPSGSSPPAPTKPSVMPFAAPGDERAASPFIPTAPSVTATLPTFRAAADAEKSVAPRPQTREEGGGGGGTVMLDGRLVGYWLAEQMARDASRPPAGTTFFDSRQTPAWTASGALP